MPMAQVNTIAVFPKTVYRYLIGRIGQTVNPAMAYKNVESVDNREWRKFSGLWVDNLQDRTSSIINTCMDVLLKIAINISNIIIKIKG